MSTGKAFVFDAGSFYGHNEYETGNWRTPRHRLSDGEYIKGYKKRFPVSQPEDDWDARNLLYSLTFNIGNTIYVPGSSRKQVIYDDMTRLCEMFCEEDLNEGLRDLSGSNSEYEPSHYKAADPDHEDGDEEEEENGEEEEEVEEEEAVAEDHKKEGKEESRRKKQREAEYQE